MGLSEDKEPVVEPSLDLWEKNTITVVCPYCHQGYYLAPKQIEERVRDATRQELISEFVEDLKYAFESERYLEDYIKILKKWEERAK